MKGFMAFLILIFCVFLFIPIFLLIFEHMVSEKDSILQKLLNNINN
jgi:hypothetical protein